jgi:hypothetical protein
MRRPHSVPRPLAWTLWLGAGAAIAVNFALVPSGQAFLGAQYYFFLTPMWLLLIPPITERPTSRWRASPVTHGATGRIVWSALLVGFAAFLTNLATGGGTSLIFVLSAVPVWLVLPLFLRDVWRPARRREVPPRLSVPAAPVPGEGIQDRRPPSRW